MPVCLIKFKPRFSAFILPQIPYSFMGYENFRAIIRKYWKTIIIAIIFLASVTGYGIVIYLSNFSQVDASNLCKKDLFSSLKNISDYIASNNNLTNKNNELLIENQNSIINNTKLAIENQKLILLIANQTNIIVGLQLNYSTSQTSLQQNNATYTALLTVYARQYCCSTGDVSLGNVRNWSIVGNDIACYGNSTVNCKI